MFFFTVKHVFFFHVSVHVNFSDCFRAKSREPNERHCGMKETEYYTKHGYLILVVLFSGCLDCTSFCHLISTWLISTFCSFFWPYFVNRRLVVVWCVWQSHFPPTWCILGTFLSVLTPTVIEKHIRFWSKQVWINSNLLKVDHQFKVFSFFFIKKCSWEGL